MYTRIHPRRNVKIDIRWMSTHAVDFTRFPVRWDTFSCQFKLNALNESAWYRSNTHRHLQHQRPSRWLEGRRGKPPKTTPFIAHPKPMLSMLDRKQAGRKRNLFYTPQLLLCFLQSLSLIQPYSKRRDDKQ